MGRQDWYHVSSHGAVLFYVAADPDCTIDEITGAMSLTRRTVYGIIGDLRRAGMLRVRKEGRRHHYTVNPDAPLRHPVLKGHTVSAVVGGIAERAGQIDLRPRQ
jgi:DNA-binding transcriptional ArsR family regulator